jgi:glycosyltransferase involved in cell wall biosynthesis
MDVKVSIIIPVYNAEKFLGECIESLLNQTIKECEFIFVNDGSKDQSEKIIRNYLQIDKRIILINQENQGVSSARNKGLVAARGEYIGFVDADDFVKEDMYGALYNAAKLGDFDSVLTDFQSERENQFSRHSYPFPKHIPLNKDFITEKLLPYLLEKEDMNTACNKVYKRSIIFNNSIRFPEKMAIGEDGLFNLTFFQKAESFYYINYSGYFYRTVLGSATRNQSSLDHFNKVIEIYNRKELEQFADILGEETLKGMKSRKLVKSILSCIYQIVSAEEKSTLFKFKYIKSIINHKYVRESLSYYSPSGRYEQIFVKMMKNRLSLGILLTALYSYKRNENKGGQR